MAQRFAALPPMKKSDPSLPIKPSVQVLERMFTLIDVLASREDAISLKEISEKTLRDNLGSALLDNASMHC